MTDLSTPTKRQKFEQRKIILVGESQRELAIAAVRNAPLGVEVLIRDPVKVRGLDQNALMWVGPLADIASQAWVAWRQYSAEVWHEQFKREYLPEENDPNLGELVKNPETYRKWAYTPYGDRVLVGSTTGLTKRGFSQYLQQVEAFGASLGVQFSAPKGGA